MLDDLTTRTVDQTVDRTAEQITLAERYAAHNYHPLPVVAAEAEGAWVTGVDGRRYLDCLAGYSALNFGHRHPAILAAAREQLDRLTLISRAFHHDQFGAFCAELAGLVAASNPNAGNDGTGSGASPDVMVLPMNTGAEAVETALKVARKWGYERKGVPDGQATIVVAAGNFHGRTITIVSFSDDPDARDHYGPYTPGFVTVPYGDAGAIADAIDDTTVAVLIEPVQGEAGVIVPPEGYLRDVRRTCTERGVLLLADEIQAGLGRTGTTFACDREGVVPDLYILGKALGGGVVPVSAVAGSPDVLGVVRPGQHGSTFGGNPLACAVGRAVVGLLADGSYQRRAADMGAVLTERLNSLLGKGLVGVRTAGLWAGVDVDPALGTGRDICAALAERGVLAKDTHGSTIRLAPPLVIEQPDLEWAVDQLAEVLRTR
ncbi:ornithine--oxo-acid transaminase [Actinopolymorpha cephalotaxi]|uniref:ornithine aminotransferase n=1 Tax=Actinopolymorpha cephalotaxi TaxID=504797 RepID=A0A1I2W4Z8_9ACTN|nr:ornithine--oxo-acid transaminase [Actinopolymorpha cephalotaxi]NYH82750.1 ornithine--oxo-acid transaminase [Actinopolymorpha cephalotaxi]SFG96474.1 ornithine--oxo-acid transaminase [Actinopolymorpha cephalotaxi]